MVLTILSLITINQYLFFLFVKIILFGWVAHPLLRNSPHCTARFAPPFKYCFLQCISCVLMNWVSGTANTGTCPTTQCYNETLVGSFNERLVQKLNRNVIFRILLQDSKFHWRGQIHENFCWIQSGMSNKMSGFLLLEI